MTNYRSLNHTKWACQYHVVFIPKYRKKAIYGELRGYLGEVLRRLAQQRESEVEEGHLLVDHVHMLLSIPPKHSVAQGSDISKGRARFTLPGSSRVGRAISSGSTFGPEVTLCPQWVAMNRRYARTSRTRNWKTGGKTNSGWKRVATCKVAQVAAERPRPRPL